MAENHGLCHSHTPVEVTQNCELVLLALAEDIELLYGVQSLLLASQSDDVGLGNDHLRKSPHRFLKGCREEEHLAVFC